MTEHLNPRQLELDSYFVTLDQLSIQNTGRYLIKGILDRGAFSCVFGPSHVGKSFFAMDIALHVSAALPWFGHRVAEGAGPAFYIASEGSAGLGKRKAALMLKRQKEYERAVAGGMSFLQTSVDLCGESDAEEVIRLVERNMETPPSLVIVDTLARSMGRGNENDGRDMGAVAASCGRLQAALDAHVMLVHHTGKDAARGARGHYSLHAAIDTEIELKFEDRAAKRARAEFTKTREYEGASPIYFRLSSVEIGTDEDGDPITSAVIDRDTAEKKTGQGAISGNATKMEKAKGRAIAALSLLPSGAFSAADAATILSENGIISSKDKKSARESARNILRRLAKLGLVVEHNSGEFLVVAEGGDHEN